MTSEVWKSAQRSPVTTANSVASDIKYLRYLTAELKAALGPQPTFRITSPTSLSWRAQISLKLLPRHFSTSSILSDPRNCLSVSTRKQQVQLSLPHKSAENNRYYPNVSVSSEPAMSVAGKRSNVMEITHAFIARYSFRYDLLATPLQVHQDGQTDTARLFLRQVNGKEEKNASDLKYGGLGE